MVKETKSKLNPFNWFSKKENVELGEAAAGHEENYLKWGTSGTEIYSGMYNEEYLQKLRGMSGVELWDEMERSDSQVKMLLSVVSSPILRAKWDITAVDDTDEEIFIKEFVEFVLFNDISSPCGMKRKTWMQFLEEALSCVKDGFSLFEVINKVVTDHPKYGSYIGIRDLAWRSPRTIEEWNLNRDGTIKNVRQVSQGDLDVDVEIPGKYLMPISINKKGDNYEGISALRPIYGNFFRKSLLLELQGVGYERGALGIPKGTIPKDKVDKADQIAAFEEMLSKFTSHEQGYMTHPEGWDIENFKLEFDGEALQKAIENEDKRMAKAFLANFMELGMGSSGGGSYSLGSDLSDIFLSAIEVYARKVTEAINDRVIRQVVDAKFGKRDIYPKLTFSGINDKAGEEQSKILKNLVESNLIDPTDVRIRAWVHGRFDLPEFVESTEKEMDKDENDDDAGLDSDPVNPNLCSVFTGAFLDEGETEFATLTFDKALFDREAARAWATSHGFKVEAPINENDTLHIIPQQKELKIYDSITEQKLAPGVTVTIGKLTSVQFSEVVLAESPSKVLKKTVSLIREGSKDTAIVLERNLKKMADGYIKRFETMMKKKPDTSWRSNAISIQVPGLSEYKKELREVLIDIVSDATIQARQEVPKASVQFNEAKLKAVPKGTIDKLNAQIELMVKTQEADLEKRVLFQFGTSVNRTKEARVIIDDLKQEAILFAEGAAVNTAAKNSVSDLVNVARFETFQSPEVFDEIESLIFMNQDPQAAICKNLAGRVFRKDDPAAQANLPPLHHNCESILVPQFTGVKGNRPLGELGLQPSGENPDGSKADLNKIMKSKTF